MGLTAQKRAVIIHVAHFRAILQKLSKKSPSSLSSTGKGKRKNALKGFITVTCEENGRRVLIPVSQIIDIQEYKHSTYVITYRQCKPKKTYNNGFFAEESFDEVVAKIKEATE
ncbi:MAG: hypothetical protein HFE40_05065 [Clostridia bacterium]|nr:hypothetical protein [Clostridia bacterium]